jgi:hypothetical protein
MVVTTVVSVELGASPIGGGDCGRGELGFRDFRRMKKREGKLGFRAFLYHHRCALEVNNCGGDRGTWCWASRWRAPGRPEKETKTSSSSSLLSEAKGYVGCLGGGLGRVRGLWCWATPWAARPGKPR